MKTSDLKVGDFLRFRQSIGGGYEVISVEPLTTIPWMLWRPGDIEHCDIYRKVNEPQKETIGKMKEEPMLKSVKAIHFLSELKVKLAYAIPMMEPCTMVIKDGEQVPVAMDRRAFNSVWDLRHELRDKRIMVFSFYQYGDDIFHLQYVDLDLIEV